MTISRAMKEQMGGSSLIRKMFEEGERLKKIYGEDKVYDFSLGNPDLEPPQAFSEAFRELALNPIRGMHRYMSNAGYMETRSAVAEVLAEKSGKPVTGEHVIMTVGASGALNCALKAILDPGDEVIILAPFFVEYKFYIANHGGVDRIVDTQEDFQIDIAAIEQAINPRTRAVIINTPNNPTGVIYTASSLEALNTVLEEASKNYGRPIYVISDEPYAKIAYDGVEVPPVFKHIRYSILVTSHSKDLALPGERIGYLAANPDIPEVDLLMGALTLANRVLGYVNAPALMQRIVAKLQRESVDIAAYQDKRDLLYNSLTEMGYKMVKPQGAFYLFPQSPTPDEMEFVQMAQKKNLLVVPGIAFGKPGYFRISYCVDRKVIENALPVFQELAEELNLKK
ncbi:MAG: pyridoxal phosphate-dependent aminotransferase [Syntrophomonadaceae bacterium]|nr:pyridoxal phosphate-dependent aminotransferase [Syntrophomonadaceae bacterium]